MKISSPLPTFYTLVADRSWRGLVGAILLGVVLSPHFALGAVGEPPGILVSGRLMSLEDRPVVSSELTVELLDSPCMPNPPSKGSQDASVIATSHKHLTAKTNREGRFALAFPTTGLWRLSFPGEANSPSLVLAITNPVEAGDLFVDAPAKPLGIVEDRPLPYWPVPGTPASMGTSLKTRVVQRDGSAVPEALVWLEGTTCYRRADEAGRVTIPRPRGSRFLGVGAPGFETGRVDLEGFELSERQPLQLVARSLALAGRVVDPARRGVEAAEIEIRDRTRVLTTVQTAPDGTFEVGSLPQKRLRIAVRKEGFLPLTRSIDGDEGKPPEARKLEWSLAPIPSVSGQAVDSGGFPLAGVEVSLGWEQPIDTVVTADDGKFSLVVPEQGWYELRFRLAGFAQVREPVHITDRSGDVNLGIVELGEPVVRSGRVVDEEGEPVAEADIYLALTRRSPPQDLGARPPTAPEVTTDGEGKFDLEDLQGGEEYDLQIWKRGFAPHRLQFTAQGAGGDVEGAVEPERAEPWVFTLKPAVELTVRVLDEEGGPASGATVKVDVAGANWLEGRVGGGHITGAEGTVIYEAVPPGPATIEVAPGGDQPTLARSVRPFLVPSDVDSAEFVIFLQRAGALIGRVEDGAGRPLEGVQVRLLTSSAEGRFLPGPMTMSSSDASGRFELWKLEPGEHVLLLTRRGYQDLTARVLVVAGQQSHSFQMTALPRGTITGTVRSAEGNALGGIPLWIDGPGGQLDTVTDTGGGFRFKAVPEGVYRVHLASGEWRPVPASSVIEVRGPEIFFEVIAQPP